MLFLTILINFNNTEAVVQFVCCVYSFHDSCVGTILSDVSCRTKWVLYNNTVARQSTSHPTASTLLECQKACEFDPHCVGINWNWSSSENKCFMNVHPNHRRRQYRPSSSESWVFWWSHYELVSRCNITLGQCYDSNVVPNIHILKTS